MNKLIKDIYLWLIISIFIFFAVLFFNPHLEKDAFAHFIFLRSLYFDGDLNLYNEYAYAEMEGVKWVEGPGTAVETIAKKAIERGYKSHVHSIGTPIFLAPFIFFGDISARSINLIKKIVGEEGKTKYLTNGFSIPYKIAISIGTALYSLMGIILLYQFLIHFYPQSTSAFIVIALMSGSSFISLAFLHPGYRHPISVLLFSAFLLLWTKWGDSIFFNGKIAFNLGLILGLLLLTDIQSGYFIIVFSFWWGKKIFSNLKVSSKQLQNFFLVFMGFLAGFLPQIITWHVIYGTYFHLPYERERFSLLKPKFYELFLNPSHGILGWTPLVVIGLAGLLVIPVKKIWWLNASLREGKNRILKEEQEQKSFLNTFLLIISLIHLYLSSVYSGGIGDIYGNRRFMVIYPAIAFGLGNWLDLARKKGKAPFSFTILVFAFLALITFLITPLYYRGSPKDYILSIGYLFLFFPGSFKNILRILSKSYLLNSLLTGKIFLYFLIIPLVSIALVLVAFLIASFFLKRGQGLKKGWSIIFEVVVFILVSAYFIYCGINVRQIYTAEIKSDQKLMRISIKKINKNRAYEAEAWTYFLAPLQCLKFEIPSQIEVKNVSIICGGEAKKGMGNDFGELKLILRDHLKNELKFSIPIKRILAEQAENKVLEDNIKIDYKEIPFKHIYKLFAFIQVNLPVKLRIEEMSLENGNYPIVLKGIALE